MSSLKYNNSSFLVRFGIYQHERFPFIGHSVLILLFNLAAYTFSQIIHHRAFEIDWSVFLPGIFITLSSFFLLRISDEFKDAEDDAKFRKYLPVPRGLISLNELKITAVVTILLQFTVILFYIPQMWWAYLIIMGYLFLMHNEFWAPEYLKKKPALYMISHMLIMPLIDLFASGIDWIIVEESNPSFWLLLFYAISLLNGFVMEIGRKLKSTKMEEEGVMSYTKAWGKKKAPIIWLVIVSLNGGLALVGLEKAGFGLSAYLCLVITCFICLASGLLFLLKSNSLNSKILKVCSVLWTFGMYASLGLIYALSSYF